MRLVLLLSALVAVSACGLAPMKPVVTCESHITVPNVNTPTMIKHTAWTMEDGTVGSTCNVIMRGMGIEATSFHHENSVDSAKAKCVVMRNPTQNQENMGTWTFEIAQDWKTTKVTLDLGRPYTPLVWDLPCKPVDA